MPAIRCHVHHDTSTRPALQHTFLFKGEGVLQVMAEAADLCCHTLVHHCPSPRLLKPIADAICTDRNAKLRQCCAKYMLQASLFSHRKVGMHEL